MIRVILKAFLLMTFTGPQLREVFWGLGYLFAAHGFAVLSYDKRGAGKSTGNWGEASFEDLADDAVAAARFLQARNEIAANQIGFWGSKSGWLDCSTGRFTFSGRRFCDRFVRRRLITR